MDLVLLGLGVDSHVASLFPGHQSLRGWILAMHTPAEPPSRVTMTLPFINASRCAIVLATSPDKTAAVRRALTGDDLPACRVQLVAEPSSGSSTRRR